MFGVQLLHGAPHPNSSVDAGIGKVIWLSKGRWPTPGGPAALGHNDAHGDAVKISAKGCSRLVPFRASEDGDKRFLREFFGASRVFEAAPEEIVDRVAVASKEFAEALRIAEPKE